MIAPSLTAALGEQFEFQITPRGLLAVRRDVLAELTACGFGLDSDGGAVPSSLGGRNPLLELRAGAHDLLVRRFTHGGLLRWLTGRRFLDPERPFVEAQLSEQLLAAGVLTPQVVAARARRVAGAWHLDLVTRRVPGGEDFAAWLERERDSAARARLLASFGAWLRRLHDLGFLHADLHPKNVLVTHADQAPQWWLIDLDRSALRSTLSERERCANLARLVRYVWRRRAQLHVGARELVRALGAYEPVRSARRALARSVAARVASGLALHRAGWWLEARAARR